VRLNYPVYGISFRIRGQLNARTSHCEHPGNNEHLSTGLRTLDAGVYASFSSGRKFMTVSDLLKTWKNRLSTPAKSGRRHLRQPMASSEILEDRRLLTSFTTDVDGDGFFSPLTDGITAFRYLSGQTGESLVQGSVNPNGRRTDPAEIVAFLDSPEMQQVLDLDDDGVLSPLTDGVLMIRGLSGTTGDDLTSGAANSAGQRSIASHIEFLIELTSSPNDIFAATEGEVLTVAAADGVLTNDPLSSVVSTFDATSDKGAIVDVFNDGGFTYDPTTSATIRQLTAAESVSDSFTYTIELPGGIMLPVTVEISVSGRSNGGEDRLTTDDNTPIGSLFVPFGPKGPQPTEPESLLTNDEGTGLTVVDHTSVSNLGARVIVKPDGTWHYNPTTSDLLNAMAVGESQLDQFQYTTEDSSGQRREVDVVVEVAGANDAPIAPLIIRETVTGDADLVISPLDLVTDAESGATFTLISLTTARLKGTATLNDDGTVTYSPSGTLAFIPRGALVRERMQYRVADQHGAESVGELFVFVTGGAHTPTADDDDLTATSFSNVTATRVGTSVLSNDRDRDFDELVLLNPGAVITNQGATVILADDGSFVYDPLPSTALQNLATDQTARDSFSYTITDVAGNGEATATVFFDVTGADLNNPEVNLSIAGVSSDRNRTEVSLIAGFDPSTGQTNDRLYVFDEVNRTALLDLPIEGIDTITITGTRGADYIYVEKGTFPVPITIRAGDGDDILVGGSQSDFLFGEGGNDVILGGSAVNSISGGPGNDEIRDQGINVFNQTKPDSVSAWQVPSLNSTPSSASLQAIGDLSVSLIGLAELGDTKVAVTGPSGYGFELTGTWNVSSEADRGETFTGTNVAMQTAVGAIPLGNVTLHAGPDSGQQIFGHGPLESGSGGIFSATNLLFNNPVVNEINNLTGFDFNSNLIEDQDFNFGLKLGSDLKANDLKNFNAPLNPAVPYLFATFNPEPNQVSLGNFSVAPPSKHAQFAFVMDPADPFFWINGEVKGAGGSIGWSSHGLIPFEATPTDQPTAVSSFEQLYGNIYGGVKFPFKKVFELDGEVVLDYDRNYGPGSFGGSPTQTLQAQRFVDLFSGDSGDWQDVLDVVTNTEIGINGAVTFNPEIADTELTLSIPIAKGTLMFVNGNTVAFHGGTVDIPFGDAGSILNNVLGSLAKIDVDGHLNFESGDFRIAAKYESGGFKIGPFDGAGNDLAFQISNQGVDFSATIGTPVGSFSFDADIAFEQTTVTFDHPVFASKFTTTTNPGVFRFVGRAETSTLDLGIASFSASATLALDNWDTSLNEAGHLIIDPGPVKLDLSLSGSADLTLVEFTASANISVSSSGSFSGSARVAAIPFIGPEFSLSASVSNAGVSFTIIGIAITVPIRGFRHVEEDSARYDAEMLGQRLVESALPGVVDEAKRRLEATGLQQDEVELLNSTSFKVSPLSDETGTLGYAAGQTVTLDDNAAGYGWFIDSTPADDSEFDLFSADSRRDQSAQRNVDLLSVVMHELTHVLEFAFPDRDFHFGEVGDETLGVGRRFGVDAHVTTAASQIDETDGHARDSLTLLDSVLADLPMAGLE